MKRIFLVLATIVVVLNSCLDIPDTDTKTLRGAATTLSRTETGEIVFVTDDSITLHPSEPVTATDLLLGTRYFLDFKIPANVENSNTVEIVNFQEMRIDSVRDKMPSGTNHPVTPSAVWASGKYLNMLLFVTGSNLSGHVFTLTDSGKDKPSGLHLQLHHHTVPEHYQNNMRACLSFDMQNYLDTLSADTVNIHLSLNVKDIGMQTSTIVLRK